MKSVKNIILRCAIASIIGIMIVGNSNIAVATDGPKWGKDSLKCLQNVSVYRSYYKQKNFQDAIESWYWVYHNCPGAREQTFKDGTKIIRYQIKTEKDKAQKQMLTDTLFKVFDDRIKYFGKAGFVLGRKGISMIKYRVSDYESMFNTFTKSLELQGNKAEYIVLHPYFYSSVKMYENEMITKAELINNFHKITGIIDNNLDGKSKEKYEGAREKVLTELMNAHVVDSCGDAVAIFQGRYDADPENPSIWKQAANFLAATKCLKTQLYLEVTTKMYKNEPSAESAVLLAKLLVSQNKFQDAIKYYEEAIELEEDNEKKAKYYMQLAKVYYGQISNFPKARSYAYKATEMRPNWGEPYLLIGDLYAGSGKLCGTGTDFHSHVVTWVAVDMWVKAKSVDPSVAEDANKKIGNYSQYYPDREEIFFERLDIGGTYTVPCWINQQTKIRAATQ
ncbi:MAG: tetratricopeptide repeat protein [Bacteroidia bacterium]|nr:tetratricopeptide repeat protein [Bacteroidia bacterium]